jgi:signal transduction histidine kinase
MSGSNSDSMPGTDGVSWERLLHDLKQPLNYIRVIAQDLRIDIKKDRLDIGSLPENLREIEKTVDQLSNGIDRLRNFAKGS